MSTKVSLFTPIQSENRPLLSFADKFLSYNDKKAIAQSCSCMMGGQGVKIIDNDESWAQTAIRVVAFLATGKAIYHVVQSPRQILQKHNLHLIPILAMMSAIFVAKVYYRATTDFHICPPVEEPKLPDDLIDPAVKPQLDALTDGIATTDKIDAFPRNATPKFEEMTAPIMKGIFGVQDGEKPYIAIKVCRKDKSDQGIIFLTTTSAVNLTQWKQHPLHTPQFFLNPFTNDDGGVLDSCIDDYLALKAFIKNGRCIHDGVEWEIVGHPSLKTANTKTVHAEKIAEPVCVLLNELLGKKGSVETLPVLDRFQDLVPRPNEVSQPMMKYYSTGFAARAAVVFKMRHDKDVSLLVLAQASEDEPNVWKQVKPAFNDIYPVFFDELTDDNGKLDMNALLSFENLKTLIQNGSGKDSKGRQWELVTE